ncbi:hypothetical protein QBC39DRAFT_387053 [Podospora conica]|nr:hypothetical protein QBC39DRAFT_387053 [Schizothecium conicum]
MILSGLAMAAAAPLSALVSNIFCAKSTMALGCAVMAAGYMSRVMLVHIVTSIIIGAVIISVGTAVAMAAMPTLIMGNLLGLARILTNEKSKNQALAGGFIGE